LSADNIIPLYERHAAAFDLDRDRSLFEKARLDAFLEHVSDGGTVLDLGCGMGDPIARYIIGSGFNVVGVDSSPSMIALCRERFPEHEWIVADMRAFSADRRFDGVLAWHSFFHLSIAAQRAMFPRFGDLASPGAPLMFTSGHSEGEAIGSYQGEPLFHASLDPIEYRQLLAANGFDVLDYREKDPACGDSWIWLAKRV
jgi:cyclopropane fatty-acyl-phospholipid synthase-like methyltransferase